MKKILLLSLLILTSNLYASAEKSLAYYHKVIAFKISGETKQLAPKDKTYFKNLLQQVNKSENPYTAMKKLEGKLKKNKDIAGIFLSYVIGKPMAYYNAMSKEEKSKFVQAASKDLEVNSKEKDELDQYFETHPRAFKRLASAFINDITTQGIPAVDAKAFMGDMFKNMSTQGNTSMTLSSNNQNIHLMQAEIKAKERQVLELKRVQNEKEALKIKEDTQKKAKEKADTQYLKAIQDL